MFDHNDDTDHAAIQRFRMLEKGYAYCAPCALTRRQSNYERVRKLLVRERKVMEAGGQLASYARSGGAKGIACPTCHVGAGQACRTVTGMYAARRTCQARKAAARGGA